MDLRDEKSLCTASTCVGFCRCSRLTTVRLLALVSTSAPSLPVYERPAPPRRYLQRLTSLGVPDCIIFVLLVPPSPHSMIPRVLQAEERGAVLSHPVEELREGQPRVSFCPVRPQPYEEPHGRAQTCCHESVEWSRRVDVDRVTACQSWKLIASQQVYVWLSI